DGGDYTLSVNGKGVAWPARLVLKPGDAVEIHPGAWGNWGYLRFGREVDVPLVLGSRATNSIAGLGQVLAGGDSVGFGEEAARGSAPHPRPTPLVDGPIRVIWGLHADTFAGAVRERFVTEAFHVSARMDRMGTRLDDRAGVFRDQRVLS